MPSAMQASARFATINKQALATAAVTSITVTGVAAMNICITGWSISGSAAPAAAVEMTLKDSAGTYLEGVQIPAAAFAPIIVNYGSHPLYAPTSLDVVMNLPSLGGTAVGEITLHGFMAAAT